MKTLKTRAEVIEALQAPEGKTPADVNGELTERVKKLEASLKDGLALLEVDAVPCSDGSDDTYAWCEQTRELLKGSP